MSTYRNRLRSMLRTAIYGSLLVIIALALISCDLLLPPRSEEVDIEGKVTSVVEEFHEDVVVVTPETYPDLKVISIEEPEDGRYVIILDNDDTIDGARSLQTRSIFSRIKAGTRLVLGSTYMGLYYVGGSIYGAITGEVEEVQMIGEQLRIVLIDKPLNDFINTYDITINYGPEDVGISFPHSAARLKVGVGGESVDLTQFVSGSIRISDFRFQYWSLDETNARNRVHMSGIFESELTLSVDAGVSLSHLVGRQLEARVQIPYLNIFIPGELFSLGLEVFLRFDVSADGSGSITISCSDPFSVTRIFSAQGLAPSPHEADDPFQIGIDQIDVTYSGAVSLEATTHAGIGVRLRAAQKNFAYFDLYAGLRAYASVYANSLGHTEKVHGIDFIYDLDTGLRLLPEVLSGTGSELSTSLFGGEIPIIPNRGTPEILSAVSTSPTSVELTMKRNHDSTVQYEIQRGSATSGGYQTIQTVNVTGNEQSYIDDGVYGGTAYWYRVRALCGANLRPTAYSDEVQVTTNVEESDEFAIGDTGPAGGLIFYIDEDDVFEWTYLEAAPYGWYDGGDDPRFTWGNMLYNSSSSMALGMGKANTDALTNYWRNWLQIRIDNPNHSSGEYDFTEVQDKLLAGMLANRPSLFSGIPYHDPTRWAWHDEYAAGVCDEYSVTVDGIIYDDWFLPSMRELRLMYQNLHLQGLGGFEQDYWSSNNRTSYNNWAFHINFDTGISNDTGGSVMRRVRPVRAF